MNDLRPVLPTVNESFAPKKSSILTASFVLVLQLRVVIGHFRARPFRRRVVCRALWICGLWHRNHFFLLHKRNYSNGGFDNKKEWRCQGAIYQGQPRCLCTVRIHPEIVRNVQWSSRRCNLGKCDFLWISVDERQVHLFASIVGLSVGESSLCRESQESKRAVSRANGCSQGGCSWGRHCWHEPLSATIVLRQQSVDFGDCEVSIGHPNTSNIPHQCCTMGCDYCDSRRARHFQR